MPRPIETRRLRLTPVAVGDEDWIGSLFGMPEIRRHLGERALQPHEIVVSSGDPASIMAFWTIGTGSGERIGLIGLRPPSTSALRLRAIGWRSLELFVALDPQFWGCGLAREAIETVAAEAGQDGVTFALVAVVDEANARAHRLMQRCGFLELGKASEGSLPLVIYERAL
ncbi:MAG TPA: GNAT family N-acetyltransferase [Hyphomicrobiaceae bacterium]|nr:GNAT family N-acetyltransferase [Hyphomicrobiaceae bacterium]